ncbi:MAG: CHAD domain-containing protein [Chryseolinea sp.]
MKHKQLVNDISKRYKKLDEDFERLIPDFGKEDIHSFRLQVKRLTSLLHLTATGKKKFTHPPISKNLLSFYGMIGEIRNLQLLRERIKKLPHEEYSRLQIPYLAFIDSMIEDQQRKALKHGENKKHFSIDRSKTIEALGHLKQKHIQKFADKCLASFSTLTFPAYLSDDAIHATRKILKDMLYTWSFTSKNRIGTSVVMMDKNEIIAMIKILGEFHDKCACLDMLHSHYKSQQIRPKLRNLWRRIENKWWNEKENMRAVIRKLFLDDRAASVDHVHHNENQHVAAPITLSQSDLHRSDGLKIEPLAEKER